MPHKSSSEIVDFLSGANREVLFDLCKILGDRLGFNGLKSEFTSSEDIPVEEASRRVLATKLVAELEYFSANNIAYWGRAVASDTKGVGYHESLRDVSEVLNKQLKKKVVIPRVSSVADRESLVCS